MIASARASPMPGNVIRSFFDARLMSIGSAFAGAVAAGLAGSFLASAAFANATPIEAISAAASRTRVFFIVCSPFLLILASGVAAQALRELDQRGHVALLGALAPIGELVDQLIARERGALPQAREIQAHGGGGLERRARGEHDVHLLAI